MRTRDDWLQASPQERSEFAQKMDLASPLLHFLKQKEAERRESNEVLEHRCLDCGGTGIVRDFPRRVGVFSPSGITRCVREQYFQYLGERGRSMYSATDLLTFDVGHAYHRMLQHYLAEMFAPLPTFDFTAEKSAQDEKLELYGHADGLIEHPLFRLNVEIKSASARNIDKLNKPSHEYLCQDTCYNHMLDVPGVLYLYLEKDYPHRLVQFFFGFDPNIFSWVEARILAIRDAAVRRDIPDPDVNTKWACPKCRFNSICRYGEGEI